MSLTHNETRLYHKIDVKSRVLNERGACLVGSSLYEKIAFLYRTDTAEVYDKLQFILDKYRKAFARRPKRGTLAYTEKDAVLIAYADHVTRSGQKTLRTMHEFLNEFAKDYVNKIHFLPFYPYSSDDGFAVIDYYKVKSEFGDWDDLNEIHKDFSLMYDFVANHVSASNGWFQKFLAGDATYAAFFLAYDQPIDTSSVYRPRTSPLFTKFETAHGPKYVWTTFSQDQIDLNVNNPEVFLTLVETLLFYIEHGADTIRFDAVGYLWKDPRTASAHLPQTHMIIKILRQIIDELAPDVSFIIQANTRQDINASYFGNGKDEAHLIYNYSLPPLLLYTFISQDARKLSEWAAALKYPSARATYLNITASHDGIGLQPLKGILSSEEIEKIIDYVSKSGAKVNYRTVSADKQEPYEINATYKSALGSADQFIASQAIQLSLRGVPGIYFISLFGGENWQEGVKVQQNNRAINRKRFDYVRLREELHNPSTEKHAIYTAYKHLLEVRISEPLFSPMASQEILMIDSKVTAIKRSHKEHSLLALTNVSSSEISLNHVNELLGKISAVNILDGRAIILDRPLLLAPYETVWLK